MFVQVHRYPVHDSLWNEIANFEREVDRALNGSAGVERMPSTQTAPAIDIVENGTDTLLVAELPGVAKEDVKLSVEEDILTISGTRKDHALPEKARWLRNEIPTGGFSRSIRLPRGIDAGKISAELSNGILKVVLPLAEEVKPRQIRIS